jgi:hypothetical protein
MEKSKTEANQARITNRPIELYPPTIPPSIHYVSFAKRPLVKQKSLEFKPSKRTEMRTWSKVF